MTNDELLREADDPWRCKRPLDGVCRDLAAALRKSESMQPGNAWAWVERAERAEAERDEANRFAARVSEVCASAARDRDAALRHVVRLKEAITRLQEVARGEHDASYHDICYIVNAAMSDDAAVGEGK